MVVYTCPSLLLWLGIRLHSVIFLMGKIWIVKNKIYLILRYDKNGNDVILNAHNCLLVKHSVGRIYMELFIWFILGNETGEVSVSDIMCVWFRVQKSIHFSKIKLSPFLKECFAREWCSLCLEVDRISCSILIGINIK